MLKVKPSWEKRKRRRERRIRMIPLDERVGGMEKKVMADGTS
jgi:hypothetical protein